MIEVQMLSEQPKKTTNTKTEIMENSRFLNFLSCSSNSYKKNFVPFHKNNIPETKQKQVQE